MAAIDLNKIQPGTQIRSNGVDGALAARLGATPADSNVTVVFVDTTNRLISGHYNDINVILPVDAQTWIVGVGEGGELPLDP